MLGTFQIILWDFDGVIIDSVPIRDAGYWHVLKNYPGKQVKQLIEFQQKNGGLSRYVKFRYFYEEILGKEISDDKVNDFAREYSDFMVKNLTNPDLLIRDTMGFIQSNYKNFSMHIVSGSDQNELRYLCNYLNIDHFFKSIHGSPTPKITWVEKILKHNNYYTNQVVLIGDSNNDYEAAVNNNISFYGYNNHRIKDKGQGYITAFN